MQSTLFRSLFFILALTASIVSVDAAQPPKPDQPPSKGRGEAHAKNAHPAQKKAKKGQGGKDKSNKGNKQQAVAKAEGPMLRLDYYVADRWEQEKEYDAARLQSLDVAIFFYPLKPDNSGHLPLPATFDKALANLKAHIKPNTKIWLGLGDLAGVKDRPKALSTMVGDLTALCGKHGFSGVDLDWEGNIGAEDYERVVRRIAKGCHPQGITVSLSINPGPHVKRAKAAAPHADYVLLQAYYDAMNDWSVEEVKQFVHKYVDAGIPKRKLCVGFPLYGAANAEKNAMGYKAIIAAGGSSEGNRWTDPKSGITYRYSGQPLIQEKAAYARRAGLRGIFTWEMTCDLPYSSPQSLLRTIDGAIR